MTIITDLITLCLEDFSGHQDKANAHVVCSEAGEQGFLAVIQMC